MCLLNDSYHFSLRQWILSVKSSAMIRLFQHTYQLLSFLGKDKIYLLLYTDSSHMAVDGTPLPVRHPLRDRQGQKGSISSSVCQKGQLRSYNERP